MKKRLPIYLLFLAIVAMGLSSCESGPKPYSEKVSKQPFNVPQSWEGNPLGSLAPGTR